MYNLIMEQAVETYLDRLEKELTDLRERLEEVEDRNPYLALQIKIKIKEKTKEADYAKAIGL